MHRMYALARGAVAAMMLIAGTASAQATKAQAELASAMKGANHVALAAAIETASASGKPISARYEYEDGHLQLTVFVEKAGAFSEVFVDHTTGKVAKIDKITSGDDMKEAKGENKAMAKARSSIASAVAKVLAANPGYTAVDVSPVVEGKQIVAEVTLMKNGQFKGASEPIG